MQFPMPRNEEEAKMFHREAYETEKEDYTEFYRSMGWPEEGLNRFLKNSLPEYADELKEDGIV